MQENQAPGVLITLFHIHFDVSVCVCVLVHASWYVRDLQTNRAEPMGPNAGRSPQTTPWGQRLFLARSVLSQDIAPRTIKSFF